MFAILSYMSPTMQRVLIIERRPQVKIHGASLSDAKNDFCTIEKRVYNLFSLLPFN